MASLSPIVDIPAFKPVDPLKAIIQSIDPTSINLGDLNNLLPLAQDILGNFGVDGNEDTPKSGGGTEDSGTDSGDLNVSPGTVISGLNKGLPMLAEYLGLNLDSLGDVGISPFFGDSAFEAAGLAAGTGGEFSGLAASTLNPGAILVGLPKLVDLIETLTGGPALPSYQSTVKGASQEDIQNLLKPLTTELGDPLPISEGESAGAVQGDLADPDGQYQRQISRFKGPDGNLSYDLGFLLSNKQFPVAQGVQDQAMFLFDKVLKEKGKSLSPDTSFTISASPEPSRKDYGWRVEFDDGEAINSPNVDQALYSLYNTLEKKGLLV